MTTLHLLLPCLCAAAFILITLLPYRSRSWSDSDHYALVQKYSDAASQLTSMKVELESLREKLEFSEDVRCSLGMENAKLAEEIGNLKQDIERGEDVRLWLLDQLNMAINDKWRLEDRLKTAQRTLRIARHKEWKRWKKLQRRYYDLSDGSVAHEGPAFLHTLIAFERIAVGMFGVHVSRLKRRSASWIEKLRTMEPYPLP